MPLRIADLRHAAVALDNLDHGHLRLRREERAAAGGHEPFPNADGAAMLLVVSEGVFSTLNPSFGLRLCDGATLGGDPALPGIAPVDAIRKILDRQEIRIADVGIVELMEAYAVQAIACADGAGLDQSKINLGGGSLARGHPIGASGAVLAVRLFHELKKSGGLGLAAIAAAGGLGTVALFEAVG